MEHVIHKTRLMLAPVQALVLALLVTSATVRGAGQVEKSETVIEKATEQFESSPLQTISLYKGFLLFSGDGGDVVAMVDDGSTLLIDSGLDSRATELSAAVFQATSRPVTRLVSTHWHFDHTGGNTFFGAAGVTIIAHENVKKRLSSMQKVPFIGLSDGDYPVQALPAVTYSDSLTLQQGSQQLTLVNYGPAHTDGDTVIYIAPTNVAVVGDIFSNHFYPIIDLSSGGSIDGMIHAVDLILARTDDTTEIIPGHGPVATRADLQDYRDMLIRVRQRIQAFIAAGKTIDQVVAASPTKDLNAIWGKGYVTGDVFTEMVFTSLVNAERSSR
ncbi:MAG TPA: MBL fold metallo-hydrolase [Terriglobales bacterium]|nr:MBL fold metallo-hydrolase [Terriglobales bacterium]